VVVVTLVSVAAPRVCPLLVSDPLDGAVGGMVVKVVRITGRREWPGA
jgi:hypothetical protein